MRLRSLKPGFGNVRFWGIVVFPLMLLYTAISYSVFRGKIRPTTDQY
jgi:cytochrome bd-type quinol oxidase subunit 2